MNLKLTFAMIFYGLVVTRSLLVPIVNTRLYFLFLISLFLTLLGLIEHELVLVLLEELAAPLLVQEQSVDLLDVLHNDGPVLQVLGKSVWVSVCQS